MCLGFSLSLEQRKVYHRQEDRISMQWVVKIWVQQVEECQWVRCQVAHRTHLECQWVEEDLLQEIQCLPAITIAMETTILATIIQMGLGLGMEDHRDMEVHQDTEVRQDSGMELRDHLD